ncbi:thioesterase family protein [Cercophora scortea]|uniref:Thioesterase family protein n=1 Tax=Cercophora scortea TaxID=314031 RepID=A0AAE0IMV0_9PEZI|nr:thioesterase family protein [Cercophora scortea]
MADAPPPQPTTKPTPKPLAPRGTPSDAPTLAHVNKVWRRIQGNSGIYDLLLSSVELTSASHGRIVARLALAPIHLNSKRIMHGAVSGTICDWAGGMAIASLGLDQTGVSTDMHVSYVSTAREGDVLEIEAWVARAGKTLGFTNFEIRKAASDTFADGDGPAAAGSVIATGSHTKFLQFYQAPPAA